MSSRPGHNSAHWPHLSGSGAASYWSALTPSGDSRIIYVSSSGGNDSNNGLTTGTAKSTIAGGAALLRDGFPDHLLFKAGDTWSDNFGNFDHAGRSSSEPMVIGSYGSGARPLFQTGANGGLLFIGGDGSANVYRDYLAFVSLDFYAQVRDPDNGAYDAGAANANPEGFSWRQGAHWVLFEDVRFRFFGNGASIQQSGGHSYDIGGFRFRRCQFTDNYTADGSHAQGIYMDGPSGDGALFDQCLWDYNGWRAGIYDKDIFSHNMYLDGDAAASPGPYVCTGNILTRAASHGMQMRKGGTQTGNYVEDCAIGLLYASSGYPPSDGTTSNNTILHGHYIGATPKQYGLWIDNNISPSASCNNNLVANAFDSNAGNALFTGITNMTYSGNVVYNWPVGSNMGSYPDSTRDLAAYDAHLGGPGTFASAIAHLRAQSKDAWDPNWSTTAIQTWVRAGWGMTP